MASKLASMLSVFVSVHLLTAMDTAGSAETREWNLKASVGYARWQVPQIPIGVINPGFVPGIERDAGTSEESIKGASLDLGLEGRFGGLNLQYFNGKETARVVSDQPVVFIYYAPSATGGIAQTVDANGSEFSVETKVTSIDLRYALPLGYKFGSPDSVIELSPELSFARMETKYSGFARSIGLPEIFSDTDQDVTENRYGIGVRARVTHKFSAAIVGRLALNVDALYRDADLESTQHNVCGSGIPFFCPPDSTFTALNSDGDSGFTWGSGVSGGIEYSLTKNSTLGLELEYRYLAKIAALKNPNTISNPIRPPHLEDESANFWRIGVAYRHAF